MRKNLTFAADGLNLIEMLYLIIIVFTFFICHVRDSILSSFIGESILNMSKISQDGWYNLALQTIVIAPVLEELVFRKFALGYFKKKSFPMWPAILVTSLLFAMAHQTLLIQELIVFPMSIFCGWLFWKTNSVWPSLIFHISNNLYACLFYFQNDFVNPKVKDYIYQNAMTSIWISILSLWFINHKLNKKTKNAIIHS